MKETEFINSNEPDDIKDFFSEDIEEIKPLEDAVDAVDDSELGALSDDIKINNPYNVEFTVNEKNAKMRILSEDPNKIPDIKDVENILENNALNDTMSVDMDMNKSDDPAEVGFENTENERVDDVARLNSLAEELDKYFRNKRRKHEEAVYDSALLDKMAEFFATYDKTEEESKSPEKIFYSPEEYNKEINARKKEFLNDPFFSLYLKTEVSAERIGYQSLRDVHNKYNTMSTIVREAVDNVDAPFLGDALMRGIIEYDTLKEYCQNKLTDLKKSGVEDGRFYASQYTDAVDLVIAGTLTTKAAKNSVLAKCIDKTTGHINLEKFNAQVTEMRKEIRRDPRLLKLIENHTPAAVFLDEYRSAVKSDINKNIQENSEKSNRIKKNRRLKVFAEKFLDNTTYNIPTDKMEAIQTTYADLVALNKGKKPSEYMEKLMASYEDFFKEYGMNGGFVKGSTINSLHKRALKYYDKRQGIIAGPQSGKGASRLDTVEKLIKSTEPLMKVVDKDFNKNYKKFLADEKKAQAVNNPDKNKAKKDSEKKASVRKLS